MKWADFLGQISQFYLPQFEVVLGVRTWMHYDKHQRTDLTLKKITVGI